MALQPTYFNDQKKYCCRHPFRIAIVTELKNKDPPIPPKNNPLKTATETSAQSYLRVYVYLTSGVNMVLRWVSAGSLAVKRKRLGTLPQAGV